MLRRVPLNRGVLDYKALWQRAMELADREVQIMWPTDSPNRRQIEVLMRAHHFYRQMVEP